MSGGMRYRRHRQNLTSTCQHSYAHRTHTRYANQQPKKEGKKHKQQQTLNKARTHKHNPRRFARSRKLCPSSPAPDRTGLFYRKT